MRDYNVATSGDAATADGEYQQRKDTCQSKSQHREAKVNVIN